MPMRAWRGPEETKGIFPDNHRSSDRARQLHLGWHGSVGTLRCIVQTGAGQRHECAQLAAVCCGLEADLHGPLGRVRSGRWGWVSLWRIAVPRGPLPPAFPQRPQPSLPCHCISPSVPTANKLRRSDPITYIYILFHAPPQIGKK
jgi:hypothetical protein